MVQSNPRAFASDGTIDGTEKLYSLSGDELRFYQTMTGITDEQQLKDHIIAVQREAYEVFSLSPQSSALLMVYD